MKTALIIIDMQKGYFVSEEDRHALPALVKRVNELIMMFTKADQPIISAITVHEADKSTWTKTMIQNDKPFCINGTEEAALVDGLRLPKTYHEMHKTRDNSFLYTSLEQDLWERDVDTVILAGASTHQCIAATGLDAAQRDFQVILAQEATHSTDDASADCVSSLLEKAYGAKLLSNAEISSYINV